VPKTNTPGISIVIYANRLMIKQKML
jgi:hypothetical protein